MTPSDMLRGLCNGLSDFCNRFFLWACVLIGARDIDGRSISRSTRCAGGGRPLTNRTENNPVSDVHRPDGPAATAPARRHRPFPERPSVVTNSRIVPRLFVNVVTSSPPRVRVNRRLVHETRGDEENVFDVSIKSIIIILRKHRAINFVILSRIALRRNKLLLPESVMSQSRLHMKVA
ncbi:hypothetical protein EVAR_5441_1 [Eumeta japonica]|uniref:Uncharacterized protein n=1 Tax=Eumeta variegata TaxID=151549 RepID=A0A4C1TBS0_EUMVA|nr:hypothetical protein EVAR_5441_1 [Eumeta japonica]